MLCVVTEFSPQPNLKQRHIANVQLFHLIFRQSEKCCHVAECSNTAEYRMEHRHCHAVRVKKAATRITASKIRNKGVWQLPPSSGKHTRPGPSFRARHPGALFPGVALSPPSWLQVQCHATAGVYTALKHSFLVHRTGKGMKTNEDAVGISRN